MRLWTALIIVIAAFCIWYAKELPRMATKGTRADQPPIAAPVRKGERRRLGGTANGEIIRALDASQGSNTNCHEEQCERRRGHRELIVSTSVNAHTR